MGHPNSNNVRLFSLPGNERRLLADELDRLCDENATKDARIKELEAIVSKYRSNHAAWWGFAGSCQCPICDDARAALGGRGEGE